MVFLWNILPNESGSRTNVNICKMENDFLICLLKINFGHNKYFLIYSHICMHMHAFITLMFQSCKTKFMFWQLIIQF